MNGFNQKRNGLALRFLAALLLLLLAGPGQAVRAEDENTGNGSGVGYPENIRSAESTIEGYISALFSVRELTFRSNDPVGRHFTGAKLALYNQLKTHFGKIAAGKLSGTSITLSPGTVLEQTRFYASDLGLSSCTNARGNCTQAALDAVNERIGLMVNPVMNAIGMDLPCEQYWFDKEDGWHWNFNYTCSAAMITINTFSMQFAVVDSYELNDNYTVDTRYGSTVQSALTQAKAVVARNAGLSDREKMRAYKNTICDMVEYNYDAWGPEGALMKYGNPWQLVWVFDGDSSTKVVCEGYSKAFQYLCDLSSFSGNISVMSVYGTMYWDGSGGDHMWNVVRLEDGSNVLVDVTNCDNGSSGHSDDLFLAGYVRGDAAGGYTYLCGQSTVTYIYHSEILGLCSQAEITMQQGPYYELLDMETRVIGAMTVTIPSEISAGADLPMTILYGEAPGDNFTGLNERAFVDFYYEYDNYKHHCRGEEFSLWFSDSWNEVTRLSSRKVRVSATGARYLSPGRYMAVITCCSGLNEGLQLCEIRKYFTVKNTELPAFPSVTLSGGPFALSHIFGTFTPYQDVQQIEIQAYNTTAERGTWMWSERLNVTRKRGTFTVDASGGYPEGNWNLYIQFRIGGVWTETRMFTVQTKNINTDIQFDFQPPSALKKIEDQAFYGIRAVNVRIPDRVTLIGSKAFGNCKKLRVVYIPKSVKTIAPDAFYTPNLTLFVAPGSAAEQYAIDQGIPYIIF